MKLLLGCLYEISRWNPRNYSEVMKALQLPMGDVRQKVMIEARKRIRDVFGAELNASATDGKHDKWNCSYQRNDWKIVAFEMILIIFRSLPCQSMLCLNHKNSRTGQFRKSAEISKGRKIKSKSFWNFPSYLIKCKKYCNIEKICSQFIYIQGLFSQQWNSSKNRNWQNGRSIWHFWPKSQSTFQRLETAENSRQILQRWLAPKKWVSFCRVRFKKSIKV